jgi:Fe-S-cluster containining protein
MNGCTFCDARCCKEALITVTSFDVLRISKSLKLKPENFADFYEPRFIRVNWDTVIEAKDGLYVLALKSRPCIFLKNNKCSIFNTAPLSCRVYPHNIYGNFNQFALCPALSKVVFKINNPGKIYSEQLKKELELYINIVRKASLRKLYRDEILSFLLKETENLESEVKE